MTTPANVIVTTQAQKDMLTTGISAFGGASWIGELGANPITITPASQWTDFTRPFYPEYRKFVWRPSPLAVDKDGNVSVACGSATFNPPTNMVVTIWTCWMTYTSASGDENLLQAFYVPGAPLTFGPHSKPLIFNLCFGLSKC